MSFQILIGVILTVLPISELRGGLPVLIEYLVRNKMIVWPWFLIVLVLNIGIIFFIFFFLDFLHYRFMEIMPYRLFMERYLERVQKKAKKINRKMDNFGFLALTLFVAIPLPGTGAWTGSFVAWTLGLKRKESILAISAGVIIAGLIVLFASLGVFNSL